MSEGKARKNIKKDMEKWYAKSTNAQFLEKARSLNIKYKDVPMALNILGMALVNMFAEEGKSNPQVAKEYLEEARNIYLKAHTLAPYCLWTRLEYCKIMQALGQYADIWKILDRADQLPCSDPIDQIAVFHEPVRSLSTKQERIDYTLGQYEVLKSNVRSNLIANLASMSGAECRKQVQQLIAITPKEFSFHHISFVNCLWVAYTKEANAPRRFFIEQSLAIVDSVYQNKKKSILLCLYRAKILLALGCLADAENECMRGIEMKYPTDPKVDGIFYSAKTDNNFNGELRANGDTEKERVEDIKRRLKFLLRIISFRLKAYWDNFSLFDRDSYLTSRFDVLVQHYKEANPSVQRALINAVNFFETHKQWEYWICPTCSDGLMIMSIDKLCSHLCNLHDYKSFDKLSCEQKFCEMFLWKHQEKLMLTLGDRELVYNIYPAKHTSFEDLKERRSRERRGRFSEFKAAGENTDESNKLQHQILKACHISYCEYLVPLLRLYHKANLLKDATEVSLRRRFLRKTWIWYFGLHVMKSIFTRKQRRKE